jgi:hypothetical protein
LQRDEWNHGNWPSFRKRTYSWSVSMSISTRPLVAAT